MIPEREREALMRLTMCARGECPMCKYEEQCDNWDFRMELATKNMNILADALRKTEPTISKMEQVDKDDAYFLELMGAVERGEISDAGANQAWYEYINHKDEPQTCDDCIWSVCNYNKAFEDEPQTDCKMPYEDCEDCETHLKAQYGYCNKCKWYGDKQVCGRCRNRNLYAPKDEPQTCDDCIWSVCNYNKAFEDEPQTEYERASEQREHDILYEPTYNPEDGSM